MLVVLLACAPVDVAVSPDLPPEAPVDVPDEPDAARAFDPTSFTLSGSFATSGDTVVGWQRHDIAQTPHLVLHLVDEDVYDPPVACAVTLSWTGGTLEAWEIDTFWLDSFGAHDVTLSHRGFTGPADVASDCPALDADIWGTTSVADLVARWEWGMGFGEQLPETFGEPPAESIGGSFLGDVISGADAWTTANAVDEEGSLVLDIHGRTKPLSAADALVATRGQYHVESLVAYDAGMLR